MALQKTGPNTPKNAVIMEESEALNHQWKIIMNWPRPWDVWTFHYGLITVSAAAAFTATYIVRHHRKKLKLREFGYLTSMMVGSVAPGIASGVFHLEFISNDILISKTTCPVCLQAKAMGLQFFTGFIYPMIFSPVTCSLMALNAGIRIPTQHGILHTLKAWYKMSKPMFLPLSAMVSLQLICAAGLTYFEAKQFYQTQEKLLAFSKYKNMDR